MTPTTGTALALILAFVLPGFVVVLFQERTFKQAQDLGPFDRLLRALYYSVWCYLLLAAVSFAAGLDRPWGERLLDRNDSDPAALVWLGAAAIFIPATIVWACTLAFRQKGWSDAAATKLGINSRHQVPTGWDDWFTEGMQAHVRIGFADGTSVWGYYGERSFASYAKDGRDLYLEGVFHETQLPANAETGAPARPWFGPSKGQSHGIWVKADDAVFVEFYSFDDVEETSTADPPVS